ncbi:putative enoyl-CoA hydratase [Streptomyces sp. YIM 130001]|uniref:enoyl-CoA hydratase family protein n=1 Tax=Streptomyces sp. YIM 130001 TaxID=2259644 RepID=UPI000E653CF2|nr:enoyl-CoA hydratase family protein [Streptomyces sp. YIM 130001]RII11742.1 putative enoyl-CoA hydratase [Streptomyces sp. YIM 130001]
MGAGRTTEGEQHVIKHSHSRGVSTLTLDAPARRNALSGPLVEALTKALADCGSDARVRAVVLSHTGETFCAGADLKEPCSPYAFVALMRQIVELPKPVVARVDGHVRAGGLGLLAACDLALASRRSDFALTEVRIGVAPAVISLTLLPRMDPRAVERYYLTGERFDAERAAATGLLTETADDVDAALGGVLESFRTAAPGALAEAKKLVTARVLEAFDEHAEDYVRRSATLFASADAREGMTAFLERRDPAWLL